MAATECVPVHPLVFLSDAREADYLSTWDYSGESEGYAATIRSVAQEFDLQPDPDDVAALRAAGTFRCSFDGMPEIIIDDVDFRDGFGSARLIGNLGTDTCRRCWAP